MNSTYVDRVKCNILITLDDGRTIDVSLATVGQLANMTNYVTNIEINESVAAQNNNPVGVVSSNTLNITLNSNDRSLIPENEDSPYFGLMDDTATVVVSLIDSNNELTVFNTYYVNNWASNISSTTPNQVVLECTDLLAIINKNMVPDIDFVNEHNVKNIFVATLNKLNETLESKYKINFDEQDIDFTTFPLIDYMNLDASNMSDWFNIICQSTLTNVYLTRENKLVTDYILNSSGAYNEGEVSDTLNIINASVDKGGLVGYNNIKADFVKNTVNNISELVTLSNNVITSGLNVFENIDLGSKDFKVTSIKLNSDSKSPLILHNIKYNNKKISFEIENTGQNSVNCSIIIYGQTIKENVTSYEAGNNNSNKTLEVKNSIVDQQYADLYASSLLSLTDFRKNTVKVSGFITPKIKIGDNVLLNASNSINTDGIYKVIGLDWNITNILKCNATLLKLDSMNIDSILSDDNDILQRTCNGEDTSSESMTDITTEQDDYIQSALGSYLNSTKLILDGTI